MTIRFYAALALAAGLLSIGPVAAKPAQHHKARPAVHHRADVRYAQGFYDYRTAGEVREAFHDDSRAYRMQGFSRRDFYRGRREGMVVENLRSGDFTGGVGYGLNGDVPSFVDGYGQTHFFVGNFRAMAPHGHFGAPRPGFRRGH